MNPVPDIIASYYPNDATEEQRKALERFLREPTDQPVPIIFDNDIFRAFFHDEDRRNVEIPENSIPLPSEEWFKDVHSKYQSGSLRVLMPDDYRLLPYSSKESAIRLFMDIGDLRPSEKPRFNIEDLKINKRETSWTVFKCVIQEHEKKRKDLNWANKGIDWIRIADRIGRPFSIDINFIRRVCVYYYECIAPIVSLWLWEVELVRARQNVIKCCEAQGRHPMERLVRGQTPSQKMIKQFTWSIDALNKELDSPLSPTELLQLQQQPKVANLVTEIAQKKEYRRIARFLPSHLAQAAIDIIQWVLDNNPEPSSTRKDVVKLLQDLVNESDVFLPDMEVKKFVRYNSEEKRGGEAEIIFGQCQGREVAVRVPNPIPGAPRGAAWMREKRYKRSVVHQRQIAHNNVIQILGLRNEDGQIGIVMERMAIPLDEHQIPLRSVISNGSYDKLAKGIVEGLAYLHSHYVTHGDLHWQNILLDSNHVPKISDLGMSRIVHTGGNSTSTAPYSSAMKWFMPSDVRQAMEDKEKNREPTLRPDFSTDVYSCGVVLLSIGLPEPQQPICSVQKELEGFTDLFVNPRVTSAAVHKMPREFRNLPHGGQYWELIRGMTGWDNAARPQMSQVRGLIHRLSG